MSDKRLLKENVSHGNSSFPLCVYNNDLGYKEHLLDYHWHDEIEFLYMSKGKAVFQIDSVPVELHENEAILINSGEIHSGYSLDHSYCVYHAVVFSLELLCSSPQDICYDRYFAPLAGGRHKLPQKITEKNSWGKAILEHIRNIINSFTSKAEGYEMDIKSSIFKIFSLLFANNAIICLPQKSTVKQYKTERLKKVLNFIKENYQDKISIDDLAKEANLTRYHFCRLFKSLTGQTPVEYINCFRINQAIRLLEDENLKIMDIALEVGFDNFSYFIKKFREYKNCTPSEYRRLML
ncbi:MAG TPA: AraC family transcriptional regulator [Clostridiaceae bacterium]|nr:AraC family transcriptional regulator [Clostridiaceae bacterium]